MRLHVHMVGAKNLLGAFDGEVFHDVDELAAFTALPGFGQDLAGRLCRLLVMGLLPGLANADFAAASKALGAIQEALGDYFAPVQHGRFMSPAVAQAMSWLKAEGIAGLGQSSWGPTGFAFLESADRALAYASALRNCFADRRPLEFRVVAGRNRGATIDIHPSQGPVDS